MLEVLGFFLASFFYVGLLGMQTKVLQHNQYIAIIPISLLISTMNYWVVNNAADNTFWYFMMTAGIGSALGVFSSIFLHGHLMKKKEV